MITRFKVGNFKSLRNIDVETRQLTLLYGYNGSGKSSFLQALLFFGRNLANDAKGAVLNDQVLRLGRQRDAFYCYRAMRGADMYMSASDGERSQITSRYQFTDFDSEKFLPSGRTYSGAQDELFNALNRMQYISASRQEPSALQVYNSSAIAEQDWGRQGENAVAFLFEKGDSVFVNRKLLHDDDDDLSNGSLRVQVNKWLAEIAPGAAMSLSRSPGKDNVDVRVKFSSGANAYEFRPENVGFGISIVLPLVIMLLTSKPGDVLLIENPEAHLHPGGQSKLGELITKAASAGVQLFVETHSDHVINGIRVAVKNSIISPDMVNLLFFKRVIEPQQIGGGVSEQYTECDELHIDQDGELDGYPDGFLDEWNKQVVKLWK